MLFDVISHLWVQKENVCKVWIKLNPAHFAMFLMVKSWTEVLKQYRQLALRYFG